MIGNKIKLSFGETKHSSKGIFSIVLGLISLLAGVVLVIISWKSSGNASAAVGACGITAVICSVIGIVFSLLGAKEDKNGKIPAYIGFLLNLIITIAWICLFIIGL